MVVLCCFKNCGKGGIHRVKAFVSNENPVHKLRKVPRACEVHYKYVVLCQEKDLEPNFELRDDEFTEVEYLDEYIHLHPHYSDVNNLTKIVCKIFAVVVFCLSAISQLISMLSDSWSTIRKLRTDVRKFRIALKLQDVKHKIKLGIFFNNLKNVFNEDQLQVLLGHLKRPRYWSDATILKALKTKFACKKGGYQHLIREGLPYPSLRTLRSKMQGLNYEPGVLDDVFLFLKEKVKSFSQQERECILVMDEMSIIEGNSTLESKHLLVTIPSSKMVMDGVATSMLLFVIRGLSSNYKQIVGYEFTARSINAECLRNKIFEIIKKSEAVRLRCNGLASDMGGSNTALWKLFGIKATRKGKVVVNSIFHPCDASRKFWIIGDVPHLLKRIVQGIMNNRIVTFDSTIVEEYKLQCNYVNSNDFFDLFTAQKDDQLKLAPKLKSHILAPNNFQKMNVPVSTNLIGSNVSTGLLYLHSQLGPTLQKPSSYETTAWFSRIVSRWFKVMSSRHLALSLTKSNLQEMEDELNEILDIIKRAKFGTDGKWKPFQRGMIISTTSVLEMAKYLFVQKFDYVLPGRSTQDCVENLFSIVRFGNPKPNALQARDAIKSITISEYLAHPPNNTSYDYWDDSEYLKGFLNIVRNVKEEGEAHKMDSFKRDQLELKNQSIGIAKVILNRRERNVLYKVACHLLYKVVVDKKKIHCDICLSYCRASRLDKDKTYTGLISQPNLQYSSRISVIYIKAELFQYFVKMEKYFRAIISILNGKNKINLVDLITDKILVRCEKQLRNDMLYFA